MVLSLARQVKRRRAITPAPALALATTVAGAVVFVPEPLSAPAINPPIAPPASHKAPRDLLDPAWGKTQFAELGLT